MSLELFLKDIKTMSRLRAGLFGEYVDAFAQLLREQGYNFSVAGLHIRLVGDFGEWLKRKGVSIRAVSTKLIRRYVQYRRRKRRPSGCDEAALRNFAEFLQQRGAIAGEPVRPRKPYELATEAFVDFLFKERALSPETVRSYREIVQDFLKGRFGAGQVDFTGLDAASVVRFVRRRASKYGANRAKLMVSALRSFFRYLRYKGSIEMDLASAVPAVAQWSKASLPKAISQAEIELLISSRKGRSAIERRDYAMFLLLARLGLRAGEVVSLTLDDIDWREGSILVRGKGRSCTRMPLPADVGEAIAAYLQNGRPSSRLRHIFLTAKAPTTSLTVPGLGTRVDDVMTALGLSAPSRGAHLFRHSLATNMLRSGASLSEIGELLRHRRAQTTEIYAKVDLVALRQLAQPWPGGAQ